MITNLLNLPEPLVRAVENDPYDKGDCDFSATELIAPPHMKRLQRKHKEGVRVDASERIWPLFGSAIHTILERAGETSKNTPEYTVERRYVGNFRVGDSTYKVGAKIDVLHNPTLVLDDYKVTSVYKFKADDSGLVPVPIEYTRQMNIQVECILRETGYEVKKARIIGILRDWRRSEAKREAGYPALNVAILEVPIWPQAMREAYIMERISLHLSSSSPCTTEEMWERPAVWAMMKKGQKKAMRLYGDENAAKVTLMALTAKDGEGIYELIHRPGVRARCQDYCEVNDFCDSYREYKGVSA